MQDGTYRIVEDEVPACHADFTTCSFLFGCYRAAPPPPIRGRRGSMPILLAVAVAVAVVLTAAAVVEAVARAAVARAVARALVVVGVV